MILKKNFRPTVELSYVGGLEPFQAEGFLNGFPFYFRERGGFCSLTIGEEEGTAFGEDVLYSAKVKSSEISRFDVSGESELSPDERFFYSLFIPLVSMLQPALFLYAFKGLSLPVDGTISPRFGEVEVYYGEGATPVDGYRQAIVHMKNRYQGTDIFEHVEGLMKLEPVPLNVDARSWPEVPPGFLNDI